MAGRGLPRASRDDLTHNQFVDGRGINAGTVDGRPHGRCP